MGKRDSRAYRNTLLHLREEGLTLSRSQSQVNRDIIIRPPSDASLKFLQGYLKGDLSAQTAFIRNIETPYFNGQVMGCFDEHQKFQVYVMSELLAEGGEGKTYKAKNVYTEEDVVIKEIQAFEQPDEFVKPEYSALQKMGRARGILNTNSEAPHYIVMDLIEGEPLINRMYTIDKSQNPESKAYFGQKKNMSLTEITEIMMGLTLELDQMSQNLLVHRDITPWNILTSGNNAHLIDFGGSVMKGSPRPAAIGTLGYIPPEVDKPKLMRNMDQSYDRFSLGVILAEMLSSHHFQHHRLTFNEKIEHSDKKRGMTVAELKKAMSDVFGIHFIRDKPEEYYQLASIAKSLMKENPSDRVSLNEINARLIKIKAQLHLKDIKSARKTSSESSTPELLTVR